MAPAINDMTIDAALAITDPIILTADIISDNITDSMLLTTDTSVETFAAAIKDLDAANINTDAACTKLAALSVKLAIDNTIFAAVNAKLDNDKYLYDAAS